MGWESIRLVKLVIHLAQSLLG